MAGFYGTVSAANHNAFVFDKIYSNRKEMDDSITSDHIFLNRYVLVSYSTNKEYIIKSYSIQFNAQNMMSITANKAVDRYM